MVLDDKIGKGTCLLSEIAMHLGQVSVFLLNFSLLNNKRQRARFLLLCSDMYEVYFE